MRLRKLQENWDRMGNDDPLWAVSTAPQYRRNKWQVDEFFGSGEDDVCRLFYRAQSHGYSRFDRALDFGCGVGRLSQALAKRCESVVGVDIAPSMLGKAREYDQSDGKIDFLLNSRPDLSLLPSDSIDLIYSEIVLMHMRPEYSMAYIREFFRVARKGALIVFQVPEVTKKQAVRSMVPEPLWDIVTHFRTRKNPRMEIYGIDGAEVERAIVAEGGRLIEVQSWRAGGRQDHRYWVAC